MEEQETTHFGRKTVPIAEKAKHVAGVFHSVASRYDLMNDLMSLGTHRLMKRVAVEKSRARAGQTVLDLAGGTGDLTALLAKRVGSSGKIVLCDINKSMLLEGRDRLIDQGLLGNIEYVQGDAENLPFQDNQFDAITMAFGIRNVTDKSAAFRSMGRALKPGGRAVILEFSKPQHTGLDVAYKAFSRIWPEAGRIIAGDRESYQYLVESIEVHPGQEELKQMMSEAGLRNVRYHNLVDGIVAIHIGEAP